MLSILKGVFRLCHFGGMAIFCSLQISTINCAVAATYTVDTAAAVSFGNSCASPPCSIVDAISIANTTPGTDTIIFNIPILGNPVAIIQLTGPLPDITDAVIIDGTTQNPAITTPSIEIRASPSTTDSGLTITAPGCTIKGLIINRFGDSGILLSNASNTTITGNWLGPDTTGLLSAGNGMHGIKINNSPNTIIGGSTPGERNIISGNGSSGIKLSDSANTTIAGNWIGLDSSGLAAISNNLHGIEVINSPGTIIGGSTSNSLNVIAGNQSSGIKLSGTSAVTILGNWIGLNSTGLAAVGNLSYGIELNNSPNNTIGGSSSSSRNVIAGNSSYGIALTDVGSSGNQIKGNYIGTNHLGTAAIANTGGISILSPNNTIGGTSAGEGNLITGIGTFPLYQILISETEGNQVHGNLIGTNAAGTAGLSANNDGIPFGVGIAIHDSRNNTIGSPGAGNLISGNNAGIEIKAATAANFETTGNLIQSNLIGTDASGNQAIPNVNGIVMFAFIQNALSDNTIGGTNSSGSFKGNIISGNGLGEGTGRGIQMIGPLIQSNIIQGNYIGTASDGVSDLGNTGPGMLLDCSNTTIGGQGAGNTIAHNGETGITMLSGTGNQVSQNRIFSNAGLGIDQGALSGPNPVDPEDADTGPNNYQNFPEFGVTVTGRNKIQAKGTLDSTPAETFSVEFFLNTTVDDSGYGEGESFLGSASVTTNAKGNASFTTNLNGTIPTGGSVTAISTDTKGNSSEFSLSVRPTKDIKPGGKVEQAPVVAIVDDVITVSLPLFQPPKKKKQQRSALARAARAPKASVNYQITVKGDRQNLVKRITSKRNVVTIRNLPPGNYSTTYRVILKEGRENIATTRPSPARAFTIEESTNSTSINSLFKSRWCHPIFMPACDAFWPK